MAIARSGPRLKALAEERGLTLSGPRIDNPEASPFEALIHPRSEFINPELLVLCLAELQGQVCKLEIPWSGATGFLVGPDLVLTNYHAVQPIESEQVNWQDVSCLFDFKEPLDHAGLTQKQPTRVRLSGPDWLVDCLPPRDKHIDAAQEQAMAAARPEALLNVAFPKDVPMGDFGDFLKSTPRAAMASTIKAATDLVRKNAGAAQLAAYQAMVKDVAQKAAEAAKEGGFMGMGKQLVSEDEQQALNEINQMLS